MSKSHNTVLRIPDSNSSPKCTLHVINLFRVRYRFHITPVVSWHIWCTRDNLLARIVSAAAHAKIEIVSHALSRAIHVAVFVGTSRPLIAFDRLAAVCRRRREDDRTSGTYIICAADRTGGARPGQEGREIEEIAPSFRWRWTEGRRSWPGGGRDRHERKEVIIKTHWDRARGATLLVLGPVPEPFHLIRLDII